MSAGAVPMLRTSSSCELVSNRRSSSVMKKRVYGKSWTIRSVFVQTDRVGLDGGCFRSPVESSTLPWRPLPMTGGRLRRRSLTGE